MALAYRTVRNEIESYGHGLADKPELVALSKCDILQADERKTLVAALAQESGEPVIELSAVSREGLADTLRLMAEEIVRSKAGEQEPVEDTQWQPIDAVDDEK